MTITVGRRDASMSRDAPLTWRPVRIGSSERFTAMVVCANGHSGLLEDHEIGPDGTVSPSLVCPEVGCPWHETIRLDGWGLP